MCLFATTQKAIKAKEDIHVYKVVIIKGEKYYTPFQDTLLSETPSCSRTTVKNYYGKFTVNEEGIHAYTIRTYAVNMAACFSDSCVIEGIIPKGTYYWINKIGTEIAAKHIYFNLKEYKENWFKRLIRKVFK